MGLFKSILNRFRGNDIDWDDLEETLIYGDLGIRLTTEIVDRLRDRKGKSATTVKEKARVAAKATT